LPAETTSPTSLDHLEDPTDKSTRTARVVSDVFSPPWVMITTQLLVALAVSPTTTNALKWAGLTSLFTALIPYVFVLAGVRLGRWTDRNIRVRQQRVVPILFGLCTCLIGLVALYFLGAPQEVIAVTVAPIAAIPAFLIVNGLWTKLSIHTGCMVGSIIVLTTLFGPVTLAVGAPLLALTGWSRLRLRHHTLGQVLLGGMVGGAITAATYLSLT
jgi:hypothetical protein